MPRVKRGTVRRAKRKKLLKRVKGFFLNKSKLYRAAKEAADKSANYAFSGRRRKTGLRFRLEVRGLSLHRAPELLERMAEAGIGARSDALEVP